MPKKREAVPVPVALPQEEEVPFEEEIVPEEEVPPEEEEILPEEEEVLPEEEEFIPEEEEFVPEEEEAAPEEEEILPEIKPKVPVPARGIAALLGIKNSFVLNFAFPSFCSSVLLSVILYCVCFLPCQS